MSSDDRGSQGNDGVKIKDPVERIMIGKILADRYQVTEVREGGRVLVAEDTHRPGYPLCLIQRLQGAVANPQGFQIAKLILEQRVEAIGRLGKYSQIPAALTFFELESGLYLLEEMVMGHPFTQELVPGEPWSEVRTYSLMQEILEILAYMHQYDVVLRGLRPENLVRRQTDGKLVVVNLLLLPPKVRPSQAHNSSHDGQSVEIGHLYMSPEQIKGNPIFSSNLYSLGMIALQALTGLTPQALPEIKSHWRDRVIVSPKFGNFLDRLLADEARDRYRTAGEALKILEQVTQFEDEASKEPPLFIPTRPHHPPIHVSGAANDRTPEPETTVFSPIVPLESPDFSQSRSSLDSQQVYTAELTTELTTELSAEPAGMISDSTLSTTSSTSESSGLATAKLANETTGLQNTDYAHRTNPTVLTPIPSVILETPQPIAQPPLLQAPPTSPLPVTELQARPWWQTKRMWGILGLGLGFATALAWHFKLPQGALSNYHLAQGQEKSNRSQYKGAIGQFNEALRWDGDNAKAFFSRGYAFYQLRNFRQSLDDFTKVIDLEPNTTLAFSAFFYRGNLRMSLGDPQGAVRDYNQALEVDGTAALAFVQRGQAENALGKAGNALKSYSQAIRLEPNLAAAYLNRCLTKSNLNDQPGAISDCTEATGINPNLLTAYQNRGLAYHRAGNYKQAIADLNVAIKLDGEDATSYYQRGLIRLDLQDREGAISDFNTAIQFKNDHVFAYYQRGLVQEKYGNVDGAIGDLEMAMKLCVEQGMTGCYRDAQYQLKRLGKSNLPKEMPKANPKNATIFQERYTPDSNILSP